MKGTRAPGSVVKGCASTIFVKKGLGSVPSKFETEVYMTSEP